MSEEMKKINDENLEEVAGGLGGCSTGWKTARVLTDTSLRRSPNGVGESNIIRKLHAGEYVKIRVGGENGADAEGAWVAAKVGHNEGVVDKASVSYQDCLIADVGNAMRIRI